MSELTGWPLFAYAMAVGMLVVVIANTLPRIVEEFRAARARRRAKNDPPINWTGDHNLVLPVAPYFDPRVEFTEEEAFIDLVEENARLLKRAEAAERLKAELRHQVALKERYRRALNRVRG